MKLNRFKQELLATDLAVWRKKAMFAVVVGLSIFPFYITFSAAWPDIESGMWELRHFLGIAGVQSLAQLSVAWYLMKNQVPNYVNMSFVVMVLFFQVTYGISVILVSNA
jgi:hypothetical protein